MRASNARTYTLYQQVNLQGGAKFSKGIVTKKLDEKPLGPATKNLGNNPSKEDILKNGEIGDTFTRDGATFVITNFLYGENGVEDYTCEIKLDY